MITLDLRSGEAKLFDLKDRFVKNNGETCFTLKDSDEPYTVQNQAILLVLEIEREDTHHYKITVVTDSCQMMYRTIEDCDWWWFSILNR